MLFDGDVPFNQQSVQSSGNKPLSMQVYKTEAEYRAFRKNRTEQWRLKSARDHISYEEQTFKKSFKSSKIKMQADFVRRLSTTPNPMGDMTGTTPPVPHWPNGHTPQSVSLSLRRASGISSAFAHRNSVWSLPDPGARARLLQARRQTIGGSARYSVRSAHSSASRGGRYSVSGPSDDEGFDKAADMAEYDKSCVASVDQPDHHEALQDNGAGHAAGQPEESCDNNNSGNGTDKTAQPVAQKDVPVIVVDDAASTDKSSKEPGMVQRRRPSIKSANSDRFRRYSEIPNAILIFNGMTNKFSAGDCSSLSQTQTVHQNESEVQCNGFAVPGKEPKTDAESSAASESPTRCPAQTDNHKPERRVSIVEPLLRPLTGRSKTPAPSVSISNPNTDCDVKTSEDKLEQSFDCPTSKPESSHRRATVFDTYHDISQVFSNSRRSSVAFGDSVLQGRVSNFLEEQRGFNKRFPFQKQELKSLANTRPDLLTAGRTRAEAERRSSLVKQEMIAEVLEKLGLEKNNKGGYESKKMFPRIC